MSLVATSLDTLCFAARSSICFCTSGVSTKPGQIAFARTPCSATSTAVAFVNPTMPCFVAT